MTFIFDYDIIILKNWKEDLLIIDENWIDLKGYEKFYEISNFGNIRNYKTKKTKKYGYDNSLIHKCCKGQHKQAYGYHWKYKED